ncbi:MAG: hypothetical protein IJI41_05615 [Anaerolineaceae bacterium]|nr:hypothetical protein [Anaerolineaceae bacterium]
MERCSLAGAITIIIPLAALAAGKWGIITIIIAIAIITITTAIIGNTGKDGKGVMAIC